MAPLSQNTDAMPLTTRLWQGIAYPGRGAALLTCIVLGLCNWAMLLPSIIGFAAALVVWWAAWRYAVECLVATANGDTEPPEVSLDGTRGSPRNLFAVNVLVVLLLILIALFARHALWIALVVAAVLLPAINLSLAFDGELTLALNPVNWIHVAARFGAAYLVPVLANALIAGAAALALVGTTWLPSLLAAPVLGFVCTWLLVLEFHWLGLLVWHYRERLGMEAEAPARARAMGVGADEQLLQECETLAASDPQAAAIRLRDRIRERSAPAKVHTLFRGLLHKLQRNDLLLAHGQTWIAELCARGDARRALGVVQECREVDSAFLPEDPDNAAQLARLAAQSGMHGVATHLARHFVQRWPRHPAAAELSRIADASAPSP